MQNEADIRRAIQALEKSVNGLATEIIQMKERLGTLQKAVDELRAEIASLQAKPAPESK
jgi:prefoldin subunit 5